MKKTIDKDEFFNEVYAVVAEIPSGKVISYGEIALLMGKPQYSRMVGRALSNVPSQLTLPCHRVVNSQGRLAPGWPEQKALLTEEGVEFKQNGEVNMKKYRWNWQEV
ncbi:MGMT family protein [Bacteroides sp. 519]|uniref:MGMT family protein n=1 Tax=Bacteroides sp. 519 TaxID=2302937 RepID=UPI0013D2567A|nr:MGMT family protein [Bacteroides sp. 519]NDV56614.1 MGMT family protein [Bacteroides sp. 519]